MIPSAPQEFAEKKRAVGIASSHALRISCKNAGNFLFRAKTRYPPAGFRRAASQGSKRANLKRNRVDSSVPLCVNYPVRVLIHSPLRPNLSLNNNKRSASGITFSRHHFDLRAQLRPFRLDCTRCLFTIIEPLRKSAERS